MTTAAQSLRDKLHNNLLKDSKFIDEKLNLENLLIDKTAILMETRRFLQSSLNVKQCCETLVKILYLMLRGEILTTHENSEIFFSITRLFQSGDQRLRRMVYLVVKGLMVNESEVFILTSSLTKDLNTGNDCYRANALRAFSKIADSSMAAQIERYLKTAVVDRNPFVSCSALLCGIHLWKIANDVVKRWVTEITECINSKHPMIQFHALILLYEMKRSDLLALQKIVISLSKKENTYKSPLTGCLIMKYTVQLLINEPDINTQNILISSLERCLTLSNDILRLEAAKSFTVLAFSFNKDQPESSVFDFDLLPTIMTLREFINSHNSVIRYAAIKQLNLLSQLAPSLLSQCSTDVELLISDPNRNIASLALTTLLRIGNEGNIQRLIKQITLFMNDGSDSLKQDVLKAVKMLCLSHPSEHQLLMSVLASSLKEEGNFDFKNEAVKAIITLIDRIPEALDSGLNHLCDFIEDCEFPSLCMLILTLLGERVPTTQCPSKYIRFIYNRLILESAHLRAAGVDSLFKISAKCPELRKDIILLLESCNTDNDDEVRDRTNLYCKAIHSALEINQVTDEPDSTQAGSNDDSVITDTSPLKSFLSTNSLFSLDIFCEQLNEHIKFAAEQTFDTNQIPISDGRDEKKPDAINDVARAAPDSFISPLTQHQTSRMKFLPSFQTNQQLNDSPLDPSIYVIDQVKHIMPPGSICNLLLTSRLNSLTEKEAELVVFVQKHFFEQFIVFQLTVNNTLQDEVLYNVEAIITSYDTRFFTVLGCAPIPQLEYEQPQSCFIVLQTALPLAQKLCTGSFNLYIKYHFSENLIGGTDEYIVEPINIIVSDYLSPHHLRPGQFKLHWEKLNGSCELVGKYSLNFRTLKDAVNGLINSLNFSSCDKSDIVDTYNSSHTLLLSGLFLKQSEVLCVALLFMDAEHGCILKFTCRSFNEYVCSSIIDSFE